MEEGENISGLTSVKFERGDRNGACCLGCEIGDASGCLKPDLPTRTQK